MKNLLTLAIFLTLGITTQVNAQGSQPISNDFNAAKGFKMRTEAAKGIKMSLGRALKISKTADPNGNHTLRAAENFKLFYSSKGNRWILIKNTQAKSFFKGTTFKQVVDQNPEAFRGKDYLTLVQYPKSGGVSSVKCDVHPLKNDFGGPSQD